MKAALVYSGYCEDFDDYYSGNSADLVKFSDSISADNQDTLVQLKEIAALLKEKTLPSNQFHFSNQLQQSSKRFENVNRTLFLIWLKPFKVTTH